MHPLKKKPKQKNKQKTNNSVNNMAFLKMQNSFPLPFDSKLLNEESYYWQYHTFPEG